MQYTFVCFTLQVSRGLISVSWTSCSSSITVSGCTVKQTQKQTHLWTTSLQYVQKRTTICTHNKYYITTLLSHSHTEPLFWFCATKNVLWSTLMMIQNDWKGWQFSCFFVKLKSSHSLYKHYISPTTIKCLVKCYVVFPVVHGIQHALYCLACGCAQYFWWLK